MYLTEPVGIGERSLNTKCGVRNTECGVKETLCYTQDDREDNCLRVSLWGTLFMREIVR